MDETSGFCVNKVYFRKDSQYNVTIFITLTIFKEKLKIRFIYSGETLYAPEGLEGSLIGRIKKYIMRVYQLLLKTCPQFEDCCYMKKDNGWKFVQYR